MQARSTPSHGAIIETPGNPLLARFQDTTNRKLHLEACAQTRARVNFANDTQATVEIVRRS